MRLCRKVDALIMRLPFFMRPLPVVVDTMLVLIDKP